MEKKYKILWIDDDVNNPELVSERDALEELGGEITPVTNPDDFEIDTVPLYDCIIIDLFMPIGTKLSEEETKNGTRTGFVLLKMIKKEYPQTKTIMYSVFDAPDLREYCINNNIPYWEKSSVMPDDFAINVLTELQNEQQD